MSSENFHWTQQDLDTCPRSNVFSESVHWTQAGPFYIRGVYPTIHPLLQSNYYHPMYSRILISDFIYAVSSGDLQVEIVLDGIMRVK